MTAMMIVLVILLLSTSGICRGFTHKDHYLLSCGASSNSADDSSFDNRTWSKDENATFSPLSSFSSSVPVSAKHDPGVYLSPFTAARIFKSNFTYTFPVSPGPKFLRLYFYPTLYSDQYDASQFFVSVQANDHLLLYNFSAQLAINYAPFKARMNITTEPYVVKEYYIPVATGQNSLHLTFSPTTTSTYAFINGIEVVSLPDGLYVTDKYVKYVGSHTLFQIQNSAALESVYRLNVGGSDVEDDESISSMYRHWKQDDPYLYLAGQTALTHTPIKYTDQVPNYTAPELVYQSERHLGVHPISNDKLNLTWMFKVDLGFSYMLRLHWCEVDSKFNSTADRIFQVYINNVTAETYANVMIWTDNQRYVPFYKDYVVFVPDGGSDDLWIALHPSTEYIIPTYNEVLLNGLEIFKISKRDDGSLNAPNPQVPLLKTTPQQSASVKPSKGSHLIAVVGGIISSILLIILVACLLIFRRLKTMKKSSTSVNGTNTGKPSWIVPSSKTGSKTTASERGSSLPSHLCHRFSISEIRLATNDFSEGLIIGHGGFGNVYKGMVDREEGPVAIAIKRLTASSKQGVREFVTEIEMLSKLRHVHLVSLIGFCDEGGEMILVYEYMDHGTLREHLYNTRKPPLSWKQRLNACLGAAKGLHYLHSGASQMIIHRDVKSTNILLDHNWVSKVSDFGLSKLGPMGGDLSHVSTAVKGSIGYLDLEYYKTQRLTEKSDVYSFGVLLFEVLCARPAVDPNLPKEQVNLAKWARSHQRKETLDVIVDPIIKDEIAPVCLSKFAEIAESCLRDHGHDRPSMADVVWSIEFVLDLQSRSDESMSIRNNIVFQSATIEAEEALIANTINSSTVTVGDGFSFSATSGDHMTRTNSSSDYGESTSITVFSEILEPSGR